MLCFSAGGCWRPGQAKLFVEALSTIMDFQVFASIAFHLFKCSVVQVHTQEELAHSSVQTDQNELVQVRVVMIN